MDKSLLLKLRYVYSVLNEKLAQWDEKRAHKNFQRAEAEILRFKDMGCFGRCEQGPWVCGYFHQDFVCPRETCPMQKLNEAYTIASYSWCHARLSLNQMNSIANAVREDMGMKKIR